MGLFSKETCCFCGEKAGFLSRKKIKDKNYICKECEKNCSAYIEVSNFDKGFLEQHMEYMKKQDILYKKEVETLDKKSVERIVSCFNGITFIDSIGMLEIISPKYNKKKVKELFRYDQILDFDYYTVPNNSSEGKKYAESGIEIVFRCPIDENGFTNNNNEGGNNHPYVSKVRIPFEKDTDDATCNSLAKEHLNKLFGRKSENVAGSIKESIFGTGQKRATVKAEIDSIKALGKLAKGAITKDGEAMQEAKDQMKDATVDMLNATFNYGARYTDIADEAEKRAWDK